MDEHIHHFFLLQKQQEVELRRQRLHRLLKEGPKEEGARREFAAETKEVLQQQQAVNPKPYTFTVTHPPAT